MKKSILLTGAMMLMMASCSNEEFLPNKEMKNDNAEPTLTIIATQGDDASSRIAYHPSDDGKTINLTWTEGDVICVTDGTSIVEVPLTDGADTNKGTFSTTEELPFAEDAPLVAYYKNYYGFISQSMGGQIMLAWCFDASLVNASQSSNDNMDHLAYLNNMEPEEFTLSDGNEFNLKFEQMGAIMQFSLTGLGGKTITKLSLAADEEVFTRVLMNMGGQSQVTAASSVNLPLGTDEAGITLAADEVLTAYMMMAPTELTDGKTLTLYATASDGSMYSTSVNGGKLEAGKKYTLSKAMESFRFFDEGEGSETSPYMISTAQHLKDLSSYINAGFYMEGVYFKLKNNIDLSSECGEDKGNWIPRIGTDGDALGSDGTPLGFKGIFDGDGKTISGFYFNDAEKENVALFGCIAVGGTLKNLHVEGDITAYRYSGGLVAKNCGTVSGCTFTGSVTTSSYGAGGIVGSNSGTVIGCSNSGTITSEYSSSGALVGGIVGYMSDGSIKVCYNIGMITGDQAGGIVGKINYADDDVTVDACYHTSETPVVGNINESTVTVSNCYWASSTVTNAVGTGEATITDCNSSTTDWSAAMNAMNTALTGSGWKYVANTDDATKESEPLKLAKE